MAEICSKLAVAAKALIADEPVAIPTETVYGLAARAESESALAKLYQLKQRPLDHPLIVHLLTIEQLTEYARQIPAAALALAEAFMPGPLTLLLPRRPERGARAAANGGLIALRLPTHPIARQLLTMVGGALAAPSANRFGRPSPTTAAHVMAEFANNDLLVVDGGDCSYGLESTIVRAVNKQLEIVRPGSLSLTQLAKVAQVTNHADVAVGVAPGTLASHYSPSLPITLLNSAEFAASSKQTTAALLGFNQPAASTNWHPLPNQPLAAAKVFYQRLRQAEASGATKIIAELPPATADWAAIRDRLVRAAA